MEEAITTTNLTNNNPITVVAMVSNLKVSSAIAHLVGTEGVEVDTSPIQTEIKIN